MMVSRRLWLAGVVSRTRDTRLADRLLRALCERAAEREATCWCVLMGGPLTQSVSSGHFGKSSKRWQDVDERVDGSGQGCVSPQ
jgi:hypothetical protein